MPARPCPMPGLSKSANDGSSAGVSGRAALARVGFAGSFFECVAGSRRCGACGRSGPFAIVTIWVESHCRGSTANVAHVSVALPAACCTIMRIGWSGYWANAVSANANSNSVVKTSRANGCMGAFQRQGYEEPPPAARWNGFAKYNFIGGHNDADQVPLEALIKAANDVLTREGRTLATYGLASGPLGYRPLRELLARKLERTAGICCDRGEILIPSGSVQGLDLVNGILLTRGDTVIIEQTTYQGALTRLQRLGVEAVGIPLDRDGMCMDALASALDDLKRRGVRPKYIYTVPTVQNPTGT